MIGCHFYARLEKKYVRCIFFFTIRPLGVIGAQLRAPLKPQCSDGVRGLRGALNQPPRGAPVKKRAGFCMQVFGMTTRSIRVFAGKKCPRVFLSRETLRLSVAWCLKPLSTVILDGFQEKLLPGYASLSDGCESERLVVFFFSVRFGLTDDHRSLPPVVGNEVTASPVLGLQPVYIYNQYSAADYPLRRTREHDHI